MTLLEAIVAQNGNIGLWVSVYHKEAILADAHRTAQVGLTRTSRSRKHTRLEQGRSLFGPLPVVIDWVITLTSQYKTMNGYSHEMGPD